MQPSLRSSLVIFLVSLIELHAMADEPRITLGASAGYSRLTGSEDLPRNGLHSELTLGWRINDAWGIQGNLGYNYQPANAPLHIGLLGLEAIYLLDIVRFVPIVGFGIDGWLTARDQNIQGDFGAHALLGVDFLINRNWAVGFDARFYWIAARLSSDLNPFLLTTALRVSYRFNSF